MRIPFNFGTAAANDGDTAAAFFPKLEAMIKELYNGIRRRPRRAGRYRPHWVVATGTVSMAQGKIFAMPYLVGGNGLDGGTINDVAMQVTTAGANVGGVDCFIKVALFADNGAGAPDPTKQLADCTGTTTLSGMAIGDKSCASAGNTINVQPAPGDIIWIVMNASSVVTVTGTSATSVEQFLPMDSTWTSNTRLEGAMTPGPGTTFPDISGVAWAVGNGASPVPALNFA